MDLSVSAEEQGDEGRMDENENGSLGLGRLGYARFSRLVGWRLAGSQLLAGWPGWRWLAGWHTATPVPTTHWSRRTKTSILLLLSINHLRVPRDTKTTTKTTSYAPYRFRLDDRAINPKETKKTSIMAE